MAVVLDTLRRLNRSYTRRIGVLDDRTLGSGVAEIKRVWVAPDWRSGSAAACSTSSRGTPPAFEKPLA